MLPSSGRNTIFVPLDLDDTLGIPNPLFVCVKRMLFVPETTVSPDTFKQPPETLVGLLFIILLLFKNILLLNIVFPFVLVVIKELLLYLTLNGPDVDETNDQSVVSLKVKIESERLPFTIKLFVVKFVKSKLKEL